MQYFSLQLGQILKIDARETTTGNNNQSQNSFVEVLSKDGRKFNFKCSHSVECDNLRDQLKSAVFTCDQNILDQANKTFARAYWNALFNVDNTIDLDLQKSVAILNEMNL